MDQTEAQHQAVLDQVITAARDVSMHPTERLAQIWHLVDQAAIYRRAVMDDRPVIQVMQLLLVHQPRETAGT